MPADNPKLVIFFRGDHLGFHIDDYILEGAVRVGPIKIGIDVHTDQIGTVLVICDPFGVIIAIPTAFGVRKIIREEQCAPW